MPGHGALSAKRKRAPLIEKSKNVHHSSSVHNDTTKSISEGTNDSNAKTNDGAKKRDVRRDGRRDGNTDQKTDERRDERTDERRDERPDERGRLESLAFSTVRHLQIKSARLLPVLFEKGAFAQLTTLALNDAALVDDDIALLRLLPELSKLNISNTGVTSRCLHHLVCHHQRLVCLDLSKNARINDEAYFAISSLDHLKAIFLRDTALSLLGLRRLASLPPGKFSCRLLTIPSPCLDYLNSRSEHYATQIDPPGIKNAADVEKLSLAMLKQNLDIHRKHNKKLLLSGSKCELVHRLREILLIRIADERVARRVGQS